MKTQDASYKPLAGRTLWIPSMTYVGARLMSAVFRSAGIDARATPPSNERTLELGGLYSSGEECYPQKVTLGDFLKVVESPDFSPERTAFFIPTAEGPCRFGQYAPYLRQVLNERGLVDIPIISPTSKNGYNGLTEHSINLMRHLWIGLISGDLLRKLLLKTRPYESKAGESDKVYARSIERLAEVLEQPGPKTSVLIPKLAHALRACRDDFRAVPARYTKGKPLIGVVGEIFCRLNKFSNSDAVRKIEEHGGEAWLGDVSEWVWYTNWSQKSLLRREGRRWSLDMLAAVVKNAVQRHDEHKLLSALKGEFEGYEEPRDIYRDVLKPGWPYLPADGALGEMALSVGKSIYLYNKGIDGIVDISPFSCMNGIVSEAVYHALSRDHDQIPIRNFYFDATSSNIERDLDIFMELSCGYQNRKRRPRRYPAYFEDRRTS